ncbi:CPBP family intramembrane glutamic endopeptidase [Planococcus sp. ISL-109]|uniref:CPBP family intramembrane glutamic endopeptidase n=1 Tax=Planococcus sp. ISL-109 TaxID=2819166 RepID=UPI001BE53BC6|nr:CPBP family intramembrane glutamic endopeptidase [Planococcus sp. ISL-109]MBT2581258.1 CPBP family intramembrane metalloprotease [Planococcus sp. ISL-109]
MKRAIDSAHSKLVQFFLITLGFTWLFWIPDGLGKRGVLPDVIWTNLGFLGAWGPLVAALFLVYKENGKQGIKTLLKKGLDYTFGKKWWAIILLLFPLLIFIAYLISIFIDQVIPSSEAQGLYWFLPFIFFAVLLTSGPLQEEFGWRGYALPRLLAKYSPFVSTLILGFVWAIWHLPQFLVPYEKTGMFYVTPIWSFILTIMTANFVYTWVFKHTNGSILGVLLLHAQMNLFFWIFPVLYTTTGYLWILGLFSLAGGFVLLLDRKYFFSKPQSL